MQIGDKVRVRNRNGGVLFTGVVRNIYDFEREPIYLVDIGGEYIKRRECELELIKDEPKPDEITITRDEFVRKFMGALNPQRYEVGDSQIPISIFLTGLVILKELEKDLFGEK